MDKNKKTGMLKKIIFFLLFVIMASQESACFYVKETKEHPGKGHAYGHNKNKHKEKAVTELALPRVILERD